MDETRGMIKDLVLGFFEVIGSKITRDGGAYEITIPEGYAWYFQAKKIRICFAGSGPPVDGCELMAPGSRTLVKVIEACAQKGPVVLRAGTGQGARVRYHFFIDFYGRFSMSILDHVDVELVPSMIRDHGRLEPDAVTATYSSALEILQQRHSEARAGFISDANRSMEQDMGMLADKFKSQSRELDEAIRKKDRQSTSSADKIQSFRFKTVGKIEALERDRVDMVKTLQEKHGLMLSYKLIACELFSG